MWQASLLFNSHAFKLLIVAFTIWAMQVLYQIKALAESRFFPDGHGGCFIIRQRNASLAVFMTYSGLYVGGMVALLNCLWFPASISSRFQGVVGSHPFLKIIHNLISLAEKDLHNTRSFYCLHAQNNLMNFGPFAFQTTNGLKRTVFGYKGISPITNKLVSVSREISIFSPCFSFSFASFSSLSILLTCRGNQ